MVFQGVSSIYKELSALLEPYKILVLNTGEDFLITFEKGNHTKLAGKLTELLNKKDFLKEQGIKAREYALNNFDIERTAEIFYQLFHLNEPV